MFLPLFLAQAFPLAPLACKGRCRVATEGIGRVIFLSLIKVILTYGQLYSPCGGVIFAPMGQAWNNLYFLSHPYPSLEITREGKRKWRCFSCNQERARVCVDFVWVISLSSLHP